MRYAPASWTRWNRSSPSPRGPAGPRRGPTSTVCAPAPSTRSNAARPSPRRFPSGGRRGSYGPSPGTPRRGNRSRRTWRRTATTSTRTGTGRN